LLGSDIAHSDGLDTILKDNICTLVIGGLNKRWSSATD
jgi:hypothetical protein